MLHVFKCTRNFEVLVYRYAAKGRTQLAEAPCFHYNECEFSIVSNHIVL